MGLFVFMWQWMIKARYETNSTKTDIHIKGHLLLKL